MKKKFDDVCKCSQKVNETIKWPGKACIHVLYTQNYQSFELRLYFHFTSLTSRDP